MHNLFTVIDFEFRRTVKKKSFWIGVLLVPTMMVVIFMLIYFSGKSASEAEKTSSAEPFSIVVLDDSNLISPSALSFFEASQIGSPEEGVTMVKGGQTDAFFYYPANPSTQSIKVYAKDQGLTRNGKYSAVALEILKSSILEGVSSEVEVSILRTSPQVEVAAYKDGQETKGIGEIIPPAIFLVLFYLVIMLLGNQMLASTTEEKENRVIEMILTSVSSRALILGKIVAMSLLGAMQVLIILAPIVVAVGFFRDQLNLQFLNFADLVFDPVRIILAAIIFVFSFLLFTGLLVGIGAIMPTAKEAGSFFGLVMFSMFIPLYTFSAIISNPGQTIVKIFTFFPMTAPITLMARNALGNLGTIEAIIGILILAVSSLLILFFSTVAFKHGTLEYGKRLSFKTIIRRRD